MIKQVFGILAGGMIAIVLLGTALRQYGTGNIFAPPMQSESTAPGVLSTLTGMLTATPTATMAVKDTDGKGIVEKFLKSISDHKPTDAIGFMAPRITRDDAQKQAWAVQFNAFQSLLVKSIEPSLPQEWTDNRQTYKVTMDVVMKPESATMPIPYFGYDKGTNIRWINVMKEGTVWNVTGIATGP